MAARYNNPQSVLLGSPEDWDDWYYMVKTNAIGLGIWDYINPDTQTVQRLIRPQPPTIESIRPENQEQPDNSTFSEFEKLQLQVLLETYRDDLRVFNRKQRALDEAPINIINSIKVEALWVIKTCDTDPHQMLKALQNHFAPKDEQTMREYVLKYQTLCYPNPRQNIDTWLKDWEVVYRKLHLLNAPDVQDQRAAQDFVLATANISPGFHNLWRGKLQERGKSWNITELLRDFRDWRREDKLLEARAEVPKGAFTASVDASINPLQASSGLSEKSKEEATQSKEKEPPKCACGERHYFSECQYYIPELRASNWQPDPDIQEAVQQAEEDLPPTLVRLLERARTKAKRDELQPPRSLFASRDQQIIPTS